MERLNFGSSRPYEDDEDGYPDAFLKQEERVDHHADYATEDSTETGLDEKLGHKSRKRRGGRGKLVPPDRREFRTPVFVPVAKLWD